MRLTLNGLFESNNRRSESAEAEFVINDVTYMTKLTDILEEPDFTYPIGSGRFGTVYRKKHRLSGLVMAEKIVSKGTANLDRYAETEKQLWKNCKHEHLVNHYGAIDTAMNVHLYFELMNTCLEKLQERLKNRQGDNYRFPEEVLAKVAYSTYSALWYLKEAHSVIHRDIKPSNILVGNDGSIKVTDFGLARKLVDSRAYTKGIGCLGYISPERIERTREGGYGTPADIWSIGISVIELATGVHPILSQAVRPNGDLVELDILVVIVDQAPPRLTGNRYSDNLKNFVERCLQKDAADRIQLGESHPFLGRVPTDESMLQWCTVNELLV
ncbi:hypothetical protein ACHWQZ_G004821 [Mnemiopsis leidyi]